jgi:signal transduction histidine kinase
VGTEKGVTHFHAGRVTFEPVLEAMREEKVWAMYEDRNGGMWFGTRGGGLFLLSKGKVTKYTTAQGLPSNNIFSIVEDAHAALWMSSSTGLFSIDRKELERGASDGHSHIAIRIYGRSEGLGTKQMNGGVQPAGIMTKSGELWFASSSGAVRMRPADLPIEKPAPVFVEQVLADGQELPRSGRVVLGPGHEKIEIHYSAISLRSPERIRFRYRLEGFEQNWADVGDRRVAYYTNLPAGDFRFRVIAYDVSVPEQLSEAGIEIRLNPRFYMTVWFGVLSLFALVSLAGSIYILHMRRIRQQFAAVVQERGRLAREMHDTLIQGCVGVSTLLEAASVVQDSSPPAGRDLLDRARAQIQLTVEEARRAVWNLRHESESAASLLATLSQLAYHAGAESGITVTFEHSGSPMPIGNDVHHNIVLIAREALHNAVRHAAPRHVSMVLSFQDESLGLHVVDDGCGFDGLESVDGRHYGLAGMRERATSIGGQFRITARSGQGTTVQVQVPLN